MQPCSFASGLHGRIMKPKTEEIVMQEMNLLTCRSRLRLVEEEIARLNTNHLDLLTEMNNLEGWFIRYNIPMPKVL